MKRFTAKEKLEIINKVINEGGSVFSVCKSSQISKPTFYRWLRKYKASKKNRLAGLENRYTRGSLHPKSLDFRTQLKILSLVHKHPELSCAQVAKQLGVGRHAVWNFLVKKQLSLENRRLEFSKKPFYKRETADRRAAMIGLWKQGWQVGDICKHFEISKPTYNKWQKRYVEAGSAGDLQVLADRYVSGNSHPRSTGSEIIEKVLAQVAKTPEYSIRKLGQVLGGVVGHHGLYNLLLRRGLTIYEKRLAWAKSLVWEVPVRVAPLYRPEIPVYRLRMILAPFASIPKLFLINPRAAVLRSVLLFLPFVIGGLWLRMIITTAGASFMGLMFASLALFFGLFFFIYSLKYYISILVILKLAQSGAGSEGDRT